MNVHRYYEHWVLWTWMFWIHPQFPSSTKREWNQNLVYHITSNIYTYVPLTWWHNKENQMILTMPGPLGEDSKTLEDTEEAKESTSTVRNASLSSWCETFLRILLKQNTALLSTVRPSAVCPYTGATSHISHIYKGINAMLSSADPSNPIPSTAQYSLIPPSTV